MDTAMKHTVPNRFKPSL